MTTKELPRYKCHKEVQALKIKSVNVHAHPDPNYDDEKWFASKEFQGGHLFFEREEYPPIPFDADWFRKHRPTPGGYYVVYSDGYESFSPAKAFEEGYTLIETASSRNRISERLQSGNQSKLSQEGEIKPADVVRSWRDNINREALSNPSSIAFDPLGHPYPVAPALVFVGGKVLLWNELLTNIAHAVEEASR